MTACVDNKEKKGGAAKAVSATLAGVLAVGMVPAVAFAADEAPAEEAGAELLATSEQTAFANGAATTVVDNAGATITDLENIEFVADGKAHYVTPTEFLPKEGANPIDVTDTAKYSAYWTELDKDGNPTGSAIYDPSQITDPGTYAVAVYWIDNAICQKAATFTIVSASLADATLYQVGEDSKDFSDTTFTYTGSEFYLNNNAETPIVGSIGVEVDGEMLVNGEDYTAYIYAEGSNASASIKNAGNYFILLQGKDAYEGSEIRLPLTVEKLNLSEAAIEIDPGSGTLASGAGKYNPVVASVNGGTALNSAIAIERTSVPESYYGGNSLGVYTYELTPALNADGTQKDPNIEGVAIIEATVYQKEATIEYDEGAWSSIQTVIDHSEGTEDFDLSKIEVLGDDGKPLAEGEYTVTVLDADTQEKVADSSVTTPGEWTIKVEVNSEATDYEYGGSAEVTIDVTDGTIINASDIFVTYDGDVVSSGKHVTYDGTDQMDKLGVKVVVKDDEGVETTLTEGTDYTVEYTDAKGNPVTEIVNAGTYYINIEGAGYDIDSSNLDAFTFVVDAVQATDLRIDPSTFVERSLDLDGDGTAEKELVYRYTGEAIEPVIQYNTGEVDANGDAIWAELPADAYKIEKLQWLNEDYGTSGQWEDVDAIEVAGQYRFNVVDVNDESDADANYEVNFGTQLTPYVSDAKIFSDVAEGQWYTDYVYTAADLTYMTGDDGTTLFRPLSGLTRGEAATLLFKMAGGTNDWGMSVPSQTFPDVGAHEFYTTPIYWAEGAGIVTGHLDTGLYDPNGNVTREQLCTMLYRYAEATDQLGEIPADVDAVLAAYPDGDAVSDYAVEAVAWAIANDIFGGDVVLRPGDQIARAEVAKMVTVLQPTGILSNMF